MQDQFNQQIPNQKNMINTLIGSIQATQTQITTTAQSIYSLENQFSTYHQEATNFATDTSITNLESEIENFN